LAAAQFFATSDELQDFLLREARGSLVVVPHQRLARQVWHRQREKELAAGRAAWEPLPLITLQAWFADLFRSLWPREVQAPGLTRLALWRRALKETPPPEGPSSELAWAQALDEAHGLLCRHQLPTLDDFPLEPPLISWRRRVTRTYSRLLREGAWIGPEEVPALLLAALEAGRLKLPDAVLVVGLETPGPAEADWLKAAARYTRIEYLQVRGHPGAVKEAVVLPDPGQEVEWVAAELLAAAREFPLHRLAVTSLDLARYNQPLQRVLRELLGPARGSGGWAYNFSQGPSLTETPLFQAALLPLKFAVQERREDLVSLLLSPYYGAFRPLEGRLPRWDRIFREQRVVQGWDRLRRSISRQVEPAESEETLASLDRLREGLHLAAASGREWVSRLQSAWTALGFPASLAEGEAGHLNQLSALLAELSRTLGSDRLTAGELQEWLTHGAGLLDLAGPGIQDAGIQVLGLLETRGLAFSRVFCLGMNSGAFPPPPRPLPLLSPREKQAVLGGTYQSQHHFAAELYHNLLAAAPEIILTRPRVTDEEERVGTPFFTGEWEPRESAPLSTPQAAWLRSLAVKAAFESYSLPAFPGYADRVFQLSLPVQLSVSQAATALRCPCRFLLEHRLAVAELPEIEAGLDPRERGELLHAVLARFAGEFQQVLNREGVWDPAKARRLLAEAARETLAEGLDDLHWQAELDRWLGDDASLLYEWLRKEEERYHQGWRWHSLETVFRDLHRPGWLFSLRGRIDRIDHHPEECRLMVWDYKSGATPGAKQVFEEGDEYQLPCYLLALREGRVEVPPEVADLGAGFIGLKSSREKHLRYEDFMKHAARWAAVLESLEKRLAALGRRLAAGDFGPNPTPAPSGKDSGACRYCSYTLICGFIPEAAADSEEEAE
jgi:RecB family exonuclease